MRAFIDTTITKPAILAQLHTHAVEDAIIKGKYWKDGKGCAVGCTIHSNNHAEYEPRFGIPQMLAQLEDCIFEGLPNDKAKEWPIRFMSSICPGSDLSCVGWKFLYWLLTDEKINPGINHPMVRDAVRQCADVLLSLTKGESAAESAANAAWSAARSAAGAAESAAGAAESAAAGAANAAWSAAGAAKSAAWSAAGAAKSAANAAAAARNAADSAESAYVIMSDKLIVLI